MMENIIYQGNVRVVLDSGNQPVELNSYYPYGGLMAATATEGLQPYKYGGKELDRENGLDLYDSQARWYDPMLARTTTLDPLAEKYYSISPYAWCAGNPVKFVDPDGAFPVITITRQKTGSKAWQRILGYTGQKKPIITRVDLYKVTVYDTEDLNYHLEFSVTRDAFVVRYGKRKGNKLLLSNVAFEPKNKKNNRYKAYVMEYPRGNGTKALKLTQNGSEAMKATPNEISVEMGYRKKANVASGIMLHVGGLFDLYGSQHYAASEGCFGISEGGNEISNSYANEIINSIIIQSKKSKANTNRIDVIIENRNNIPQDLNVVIK